jgi:hypothetical protein
MHLSGEAHSSHNATRACRVLLCPLLTRLRAAVPFATPSTRLRALPAALLNQLWCVSGWRLSYQKRAGAAESASSPNLLHCEQCPLAIHVQHAGLASSSERVLLPSLGLGPGQAVAAPLKHLEAQLKVKPAAHLQQQ